jgi:hypothetical protein
MEKRKNALGMYAVLIASLIGLSVQLAGNAQSTGVYQQCNVVRTIWKNAQSLKVKITATFRDECHEPEDVGTVTVYDGAGNKVGPPLTFGKGFDVTAALEVPPQGRIDYICASHSGLDEKKCFSETHPNP